jgi:AIPR protein
MPERRSELTTEKMAEAFRSFPPILKDAVVTFGRDFSSSEQPSTLFECFAAYHVLRAMGLDEFDTAKALVGGENDSQIDAIAITVNGALVDDTETLDRLAAAAEEGAPFDVAFVFVQATMSYRFPADKVALYVLGVQNFFLDVPPLLINEQVRDAFVLKQHALALVERLDRGSKVACEVFVVWPGTWTTDGHAEHSTAVAEAGLKTLERASIAITARFHRMDGTQLAKLVHAEQVENDSEIVVAALVPLPPITGVDYAAIGYVRARDLLAAVTDGDLDDSRTRLRETAFYGNVRAFLGLGQNVPVNQRIAETLTAEDGNHRAEFVLRNNGVTILARQAFPSGQATAANGAIMGERLRLIDFHVVNGSQTTHTLFENRAMLDDSVLLPIKIVATEDVNIGRDAVLGLNRQTPIDEIQILARNEFVGRIKRHLDLTRTPRNFWVDGKPTPLIMFERRTGEYRQVMQSDARLRIVSLEELMQSYAAGFMEIPHRVHREGRNALLRLVPDTMFNEAHDVSFYHLTALVLWRARQHFKTLEAWNHYAGKHQLLFALRMLAEPQICPQGRRDGEAHEYLRDFRARLMTDEIWPALTERAAAVVLSAAQDLDRQRRLRQNQAEPAASAKRLVDVTTPLASLADMTKAVRAKATTARTS